MNVPIRLTGTASVGIKVARKLPRNRNTTITTRTKASTSVFFTSSIVCRDEAGRVVGDFPGQIIGEPALQLADPVAHGFQRGDRIGPRRLVDRHRRRRPPIQARFAIEIGGAQFHPRDVAQPQHRSIGVRADDDVLELADRAQPALGLDVELQLLLVSNRPGADASDGGLNVLGFDRIDDVAGGQPEPGQPVGPQPDAHGVILRTPERCISDAGRALDPIEQIDRDVVRDEQRVVRMLGRVDGDDAKQGRRFLLDGHALALERPPAGRQAQSAHDCSR